MSQMLFVHQNNKLHVICVESNERLNFVFAPARFLHITMFEFTGYF